MNFDLSADLLALRCRLAAVLPLALVLSLAGCGGGGDAPPAGAPDVSSLASADSVAAAQEDAPGMQQPMERTSAGNAAALLALALGAGPMPAWADDAVALALNRDSAWGVAPSAALQRVPDTWLPVMAEAGVASVRGFSATPNDDGVSTIGAAGMSAVGVLQWSSAATWSLPADDLAGWKGYVTEQVRRYKGRVRHWEVWNEPPNFTADKSPVSYAKVVAAAHAAAKAVDPTVQIGLAAKSNHVNWLAESIAAGAKGHYDFVTLHPYEVASLLPQGWEGQFMAILPRVRKMLREQDPAKAGVPLWFTEIGYSAAGAGGAPLQADVLAKIYTMSFAQGVARLYWFDPRDSEGLAMGLTAADGSRRPAWHALRTLRATLGARPRYAGWTQPGNAYYGFVFLGPQGVVLSAWSRAGQSTPLALASEVTQVDPQSGEARRTRTPTLTEAPVLLVAPAGSAQARQWLREAATSSGQPFPWNGDQSDARTVHLTAGAMPAGVFMANAPAITVVNEVAEFNLEGSIGACFAVDPTFLPYASTPIRISAVVRGHGSGEPGFQLLYESDAPIAAADGNGLVASGAGWTPIAGTRFHEKTWEVPNARFVGMFGYNFCFYAIGPAHSGFSIRRVTVSR